MNQEFEQATDPEASGPANGNGCADTCSLMSVVPSIVLGEFEGGAEDNPNQEEKPPAEATTEPAKPKKPRKQAKGQKAKEKKLS